MDTERWQILLKAIDHGSLRAAAEEMGFTVSGISRSVATLEKELGFALLHRAKSGVQPTAECRQLLPSVRELLFAQERLEQTAAKVRGADCGTIVIGTAYNCYYEWVTRMMAAFRTRHPGVVIKIVNGTSSELAEMLLDHRTDFCLISHRDSLPVWLPIRQDELMVLLPKNHPLADSESFPVESLKTHMNRSVNDNTSLNPQKDRLPLFGDINAKDNFDEYIKSCIQSEDKDKESVADESLTTELFLYNREKGRIWGCNDEYISAPRLDDIQCAYSSLMAYIKALDSISDNYDKVNVCCVFNNEEVGSTTMQGADSTFLSDVLERISIAYGLDREKYMMAIASSYMVSADNAHAVHPNHTDKADLTNRPYMNEGIVIKFNGNQKYTTDSVSYAIFKDICDKRNVPYQTYANRSDIAGGSTLGNISNSHVSVNTVDIGLAQLAMHSAYETAGVKDTTYMIEALTGVFLR